MIDTHPRDLRAHPDARHSDDAHLAQLGPFALAVAAVGASLIGASASKKAANKAADASQAATDANIALQQRIYDQTRADNEPFRLNALAALNKLNGIVGLQSPQTDGSIGTSGAGGVNYARYVTEQPDVLANWNAMTAADKANFNNDMATFGAWHHQETNRLGENRDVTPFTNQPAQTPPGQANGVFGPQVGERPAIIQPTAYQAPQLGEAPVYTAPTLREGTTYAPTELSMEDRPNYEGYTPTAAPTFTREADPTLDLSRDAWVKVPGYEAAVQEGQDSILAERAALGSMESGAFWKALQDHGQKTADKFYYAWADRERDQHNRDIDRKDFRFENDRNAGMRQWEFTNSQGQNDAQFSANLGNSQWMFGNTFRQNENQFGAQLGENQRQFDNNFNLNNAQFGYNALANNYWNTAQYNQQNAQFGANLANNQNQYLNSLTQSIYDTDRNYLANRFDTQNNVLLNMAGMGQNANAQNANAGQNMAANQGNALLGNAANQGNAALAGAAQTNNLLGGLINAGAYVWGGWGGKGGSGGGSPSNNSLVNAMKNNWSAAYG